MNSVREVSLEIVGDSGVRGTFNLRCLPSYKSNFPLWDLRGQALGDSASEPVQVFEGEEYIFEIVTASGGQIRTDKEDLLVADDDRGSRGRLRPGLHTGGLPIRVFLDATFFGMVRLEVRSKKLDYLTHYRWMLSDIAELLAEIVSQRFAPSEQTFEPEPSADPVTAYQQFAFLRAVLTGPALTAALAHVLADPHRVWIQKEEARPITMGVAGGSSFARSLTGPGQRQSFFSAELPALSSVPTKVAAGGFVESVDNPENRFVKFALVRFREAVDCVRVALVPADNNYPAERGLREVLEVLDSLDAILGEPLFREIGDLVQIPASSVVLARRSGYREVYHFYLQFEVAARLAWRGGEDVYGAGQRDVATLYEFWCYLELVKIVNSLCDSQPFALSDLLERTTDNLGVSLKRGQRFELNGSSTILGRRLHIELFFNRTFSTNESATTGSWTRLLRPDCTLRVVLDPEIGGVGAEVLWLHFDAKYSVNDPTEIFGPAVSAEQESGFLESERSNEKENTYPRGGLLKMHTYKDAIKRSMGAYVLYPGDEAGQTFSEFHEILPGIGAFALRPSDFGSADGSTALRNFVGEMLNHLALQGTELQRGRYWNRMAFEGEYQKAPMVQLLPFLSKPPADTNVLIANLDQPELYEWTVRNQWIVLPRSQKEAGNLSVLASGLAIDTVLLLPAVGDAEFWSLAGPVRVFTREELKKLDYTGSECEASLAFRLAGPASRVSWLSPFLVRSKWFGRSEATRFATTSAYELILSATESS